MNLRKKIIWTGSHKEIPFEIVNWNFDSASSMREEFPSGCWNIYLYLFESKCQDFDKLWLKPEYTKYSETSPERLSYNYYSNEFPGNQIDFHGGITYYSKEAVDQKDRVIKVGCDYLHLHDEHIVWTEEELEHDAIKAIESCFELGILKPFIAKLL